MKNIFLIFSMLFAAAAYAESYYNDNVIIVLDGSGSMAEQMKGTGIAKIDAAKKALHQVLKQVPDTTHIGLLAFCDTRGANGWLYPLGPKSAALDAAIDKPSPAGNTPLGEFIKIGADSLLVAKKKQHGYGSYKLLIVTDGEATDRELVERYVPDVISRGIVVDVIGVGMNSRHTLATKVTSYRNAADPESLSSAVAEVLAEVSPTSGNAADAEAFAVIAPLPDEMAKNMLSTLADSGTAPIGSSQKTPVINTPPPVKKPSVVTKNVPAKESKNSWWFFVLAIAIIAFSIKSISGARKR